jgi:glucoamylase
MNNLTPNKNIPEVSLTPLIPLVVKSINNINDIFLQNIFNNISNIDTENGIIVASPSKENPDYYYHWTRDAALTMLLLIRLLDKEEYNSYYNILRSYIQSYINNEISIIKKINLEDYGEPKFYVNREKYDKNWGRPQNDGPAIRSYALVEYAFHLISKKETELLKPIFNYNHTGLIDKDLEFLLDYSINKTSFDLWEEINGYHYFTTFFQLKAIENIEKLIIYFNDKDSRIKKIFTSKLEYNTILNKFYDKKNKIIKSSFNIINENFNVREYLDSSIFLAQIYCKENPICIFTINTLIEFVKRNIKKYNTDNYNFIPIGRYYEDNYYKGNPWFLTTICIAHYIKNCIKYLDNNDELFNLKLIELLDLLKCYNYNDIETSINQYCYEIDNFIINFYNKHNQLSEQFDINNNPVSACHLTWSYASFLFYKF